MLTDGIAIVMDTGLFFREISDQAWDEGVYSCAIKVLVSVSVFRFCYVELPEL
ncbi:MAG: hypothetical protein BroJett003_27730 [Planctomycetota bacterium]|nr:MAG: hypothetical protein BroJett003_27730 [Planctomycetota bacterium]